MSEPNYEELCTNINKAMKSAGTDEKALISVLASLTNEQIVRNLIPKYQEQQQRSLLQHLQSELSGNLKKLFVALCTPRYELWAKSLDQFADFKRQPEAVARFISLIDHQDRFRVLQQYQQQFNGSIEQLFPRIKNEVIQLYARCILLNQYAITEQGMSQFAMDCKNAITPQQLFEFLATLDPKQWPKFTQVFKETLNEEFIDWAGKNFAAQLSVIKIHVRAMENPVNIVADIIHESVQGIGTDDEVLITLTAIFRDYHWRDLVQAYKVHGDLMKDLKGDLTGKYEDAILRFWGLIWF